MSNSITSRLQQPQQKLHRMSTRLAEHCANERKRCIYAKLDAIEKLLVEMSQAHSKIKQLTNELEEIHKLEEHSSHRCLGRELRRLPTIWHLYDDWNRKANRDLNFIKECVSLRCNEEHITRADFSHYDQDVLREYKYHIGDCLIRNTHVVDLTVQLSMIRLSRDQDGFRKSFQDLLHYVQTSTALRRVHATGYRDELNSPDGNNVAFLQAIGRNPNIEEIHWRMHVPPTALHYALVESTASKIKVLSLECHSWEAYPVQQRHLIPQSVANCRSLVRLSLTTPIGGSWTPIGASWRLTESILNNLADVSVAPLQELSITRNGDSDQLQSLNRYLQATTTLQHLELKCFGFRADTVDPVLVGLQQHYALPTACINKLSIMDCKFDQQATDKFSVFLKETRYNESSLCAVLQELVFSGGTPEPYFSGAIASALPFQPHTPMTQYRLHNSDAMMCNHTIGSGLKILKLEPFCFMEKFCETVTTFHKYIYLPCLYLSRLGDEDCLQLASCIPNLLSLEELYIEKFYAESSSHGLLLSMIQQCGNLRKVSILDNEGHSYLDDAQSRIANAFCERNNALWVLFSKPIVVDWRNGHESTVHKTRRQPKRLKHSVMPHSTDDYDKSLLLPMLLHVAKQVPMTRVSTIIQAMMNMVTEGIKSA